MALGIRTSVGPLVVHHSLRPGRNTGGATRGMTSVLTNAVKLMAYVFVFTVMAVWWVLKWIAVATFLAGRWAVTTAIPAARRQQEARRAQQLTAPPA